MKRLLVREYGASEGTVCDFDGEHEEVLSQLLIVHCERLGLNVLEWAEGLWQEVE
jgi:hypothetical protein